ncbi:UDP-N-acetylmuramate--L-alanine ligase [Amycolatopsis cihanbeyliensis]
MAPLAEMLLRNGSQVTGSELRERSTAAKLRHLGARISTEHAESNVDTANTVVFSTAIPRDHVELAAARRRGLRVLHRSEALDAVTRDLTMIAVAGTHGKTTTTAMVAAILRNCDMDPSYYVGGEIPGMGCGAYGGGQHVVVEADESDRSFLNLTPGVGVVTNIDSDHLNTYGTMTDLAAAFREFCLRIEPSGFLVTNADDPRCRALAAAVRDTGTPVWTYGMAGDADLRVSDLSATTTGSHYIAHLDGTPLGTVDVPMPGEHLAANSAAALLIALRLGLPPGAAIDGLAGFPGVRRRFELKGDEGGVRVYDDYACHHTSMTASLRTMRSLAGDGRLLVVCQPVRAYRVREFGDDMARALGIADQAVVLEVYGPGETWDEPVGGAALTSAIPLPDGAKRFLGSVSDVPEEVVGRVRRGDVVVTLGSPEMSQVAEHIVDVLRHEAGSR